MSLINKRIFDHRCRCLRYSTCIFNRRRELCTSAKPVDSKLKRTKNDIVNAYSKTVILPRTLFPLKHDPSRELELLKSDAFSGLYQRQRDDVSRTKEFVLHDGPPYANGSPHLGHAVNKILKDIICRYNLVQGKKVHFVPGWDCHGLPIELKAIEATGGHIDPVTSRLHAEQFARKTIDIQKTSFSRWGLLADWPNSYLTLNKEYITNQLRAFYSLYQSGLIYKDYLPVYWSLCHETALAEAELEYNVEHVSPSVYVQFKVTASSFDTSNLYALIWTTTPWTLPCNQAIAYLNSRSYSIVKVPKFKERRFIVATEMIEQLSKAFESNLEIEMSFDSNLLGKMKYTHPCKPNEELSFFDGNHVTMLKGTGLVHSAPNHGKHDYVFAQKHGVLLEPCLVNEKGNFTAGAGDELDGKFVLKEGTEKVLSLWKDDIVHNESYVHSYPYDWRSKKPVIIRASQQWFMNIDRIRGQCVDALDKTTFYPESLKKFLKNQLETRPPWCISRQRCWGVPIPTFYAEDDKDGSLPLLNQEIFDNVIAKINQDGPGVWWSKSADELLPTSQIGKQLVKSNDILDIWFDSGVSWQNVLPGSQVADMYLEGYDQIRGWFQSSLITSVALRNCAPFKSVFIHGFTVDEEGHKMSKSIGNVVDPRDIVNGVKTKKLPAYGADVLRWWVFKDASNHANVRYSSKKNDENLVRVKKIRGIMRFVLSTLDQFDPRCHHVKYDDMLMSDKLMLHMLRNMHDDLQISYEKYALEDMADSLYGFICDEMSSFYCMVTKHRLYCLEKDSIERRSCQTAYYHLLRVLSQYLAPLLPHLMQDYYVHWPVELKSKEQTIFERPWFEPAIDWHQESLDKVEKFLFLTIDAINRAVPTKNIIERSLIIKTSNDYLELLGAYADNEQKRFSELALLFQVSEVDLIHEDDDRLLDNDGESRIISVSIEANESTEEIATVLLNKSKLSLCPRCRRYVSSQTGQLCEQCVGVIATMYTS